MEQKEADALRKAFQKAGPGLRPLLRGLMPRDVVSFAGVEILVNPKDNFTDLHLWVYGVAPELESLSAVMAAVEGRRAAVFDVGANCGAYSLPLGRAVAEGSRVVAFEPNPVMVGRLGENILRNELGHVIRVEACALGASDGEAELRLKPGNFGQASLYEGGPAKLPGFIVPVRKLSAFMTGLQAFDISVLKIDIEGGEEAVLGPWLDDPTAERPDLILMETRHASLWNRDLVSDIQGCGYKAVFEGEGNTLFERS